MVAKVTMVPKVMKAFMMLMMFMVPIEAMTRITRITARCPRFPLCLLRCNEAYAYGPYGAQSVASKVLMKPLVPSYLKSPKCL